MSIITRVAGKIIPPVLVTYFVCALWIVDTDIIPWLRPRHGVIFVLIYELAANIGIPFITLTYLYLYFLPQDHSQPPPEPPQEVKDGLVIFQCADPSTPSIDEDQIDAKIAPARVERCHKGHCQGRWKPSRTRHCSVCKRCSVGFDHHCPWFDNCLTAYHMRSFIHLTLLTPLIVLILITPIFSTFYHHLRVVISSVCLSYPFQTYWSHIIFGGPMGRWSMMLTIGYWFALAKLKVPERRVGMLEYPSGRLALIIVMGIGLGLICMGLTTSTISHLLRGELEIDIQRRKAHDRLHQKAMLLGDDAPAELIDDIKALDSRLHFYIPAINVTRSSGKVIRSLSHDRPWDLGSKRANWEAMMGARWDCLKPQFLYGETSIPIPWQINARYTDELSSRLESRWDHAPEDA